MFSRGFMFIYLFTNWKIKIRNIGKLECLTGRIQVAIFRHGPRNRKLLLLQRGKFRAAQSLEIKRDLNQRNI